MIQYRLYLLLLILHATAFTGSAQVTLPKASPPYKSPDFTKIVQLTPMLLHSVTDSVLSLYRSKDYLWGEARALLFELKRYNLKAQPVITDGRTTFEDAERPFMAMIYTGMGLCNLANKYPDIKPNASADCAWILDAVQTNTICGFMSPHFGAPFSAGEINKASVLVHGQFLYLALQYKETFENPKYDVLIQKVAIALANDFAKSIVLPSYPGMWYVSDNILALAALNQYDRIFKANLAQKPTVDFLAMLKGEYLVPKIGLIGAYVGNPVNKTRLSESQGVAIMYGLPFLFELDTAFAIEQWQQAKQFYYATYRNFWLAVNKLPPTQL